MDDLDTSAACPGAPHPRTPITSIGREMNRQGAKDAKTPRFFLSLFTWRLGVLASWRLGGSKFCSFQAGSTRLLL
ncbi:hypothetical protein WMF30_29125 [Sorangium sp. So ce134]